MRNLALAIVVGLSGLAIGAALVVLERHLPERAGEAAKPPVQTAVILPPAAAPAATAPAKPGAPAAPTVASQAPAPGSAPASGAAAATPPAPPAAPDLPTVDVAPLTVHAVPTEDQTPPTVTLLDRDGRTIREIHPAAPLDPGYRPSVGPGSAQSFGALTPPRAYARRNSASPQIALAEPRLVPPIANSRSAAPASAFFNGTGQAAGGTTVSVDGRDIALFGVQLPGPRDQCGLGPGDNRSCAEVARDALAQRLQRYPSVACHVPPGQRGRAAAVCSDASGTDLGGFLVAEGYALADTHQSYDYFGAEGVARSFRRGLWRYR